MCGICGIVDLRANVDPDLVARMRDTLRHRGPDDAGLYLSPDRTAGLGHRRLSIIDLSEAGRQPMSNEDGSVWVTFNGEIYNFQELRGDLEKRGHRFRSRCDTEVIVHLYEDYGSAFPKYLEGMFALGVWDAPRRTLLLVRDRMGKKPLYYRTDGQRISFASELKALLADPAMPRRIDPQALSDYLTFQYVPSPRTIFSGIEKLPPASILSFQGGRITVEKYWSLDPERGRTVGEETFYEQRLLELLDRSVRKRLVSDVPLGVFLSGGLDSSTLVAVMSSVAGGRVKTFSVGFREEAYDELPFADRVAKAFATDHHRIVLEPASAVDLIPKIAEQFDEPLADQAAVPTYLMSEAARKVVTVCLSGEGGDEIFAGYPRYEAALQHHQILDRLSLGEKDLEPDLEPPLAPPLSAYVRTLCGFDSREKQWVLDPDILAAARSQSSADYPHMQASYERHRGLDYLTRLQMLDIETYLPDDLLVKVDRSSMLASLEVRAPMLDPELVSFALALPRSLKVRAGIQKFLLRRVMKGRLPSEILWRPKMGFSIPLAHWFRGDLLDCARDLLLEGESPYFRKAYVRRMFSNGWLENPASALKGWTLLMFEQWRRQYRI